MALDSIEYSVHFPPVSLIFETLYVVWQKSNEPQNEHLPLHTTLLFVQLACLAFAPPLEPLLPGDMTREMALAAYRHVLRSVRIAFQGDQRMLLAARHEARQKFQQGRSLSSGSEEAVKEIEHAEGVALVLRQNVVQGQGDAQEGDRFRMNLIGELRRAEGVG